MNDNSVKAMPERVTLWRSDDGRWTAFADFDGKVDDARQHGDFVPASLLDAARRELVEAEAESRHKKCRAAYTRLDVNWARIHDAAMRPIRIAMGDPNATVPEICAALESIKQEREALAEVEATMRAQIKDHSGCNCTQCRAIAKLDEVRRARR